MGAQKGGVRRSEGPNLEKVGAQRVGGPEGRGPERPEGWGPKISSRLKFHSLCSLWASSRGISVVFEVLELFKMHAWSSLGHRVRAPLARSGGAAKIFTR